MLEAKHSLLHYSQDQQGVITKKRESVHLSNVILGDPLAGDN